MPLLDVFMPNELEACAIAGVPSLEGAIEKLAAQVRRLVVVTIVGVILY